MRQRRWEQQLMINRIVRGLHWICDSASTSISLTYIITKLSVNIASVPLLAVISVTCRDVIRDKIDNHSAIVIRSFREMTHDWGSTYLRGYTGINFCIDNLAHFPIPETIFEIQRCFWCSRRISTARAVGWLSPHKQYGDDVLCSPACCSPEACWKVSILHQ